MYRPRVSAVAQYDSATDAIQTTLVETSLYPQGFFYYTPTVDGKHITELPITALENGNFAKVPVIIDRDGNEGFEFTSAVSTLAQFNARAQFVFPEAGTAIYSALDELYPQNLTGPYGYTGYQGAADLLSGGFSINCPSYFIASFLVKALSSHADSAPVWKAIGALLTYAKSYHASIDGYIYIADPVTAGTALSDLILTMQRFITSFVVDLDPNAHLMVGGANGTGLVWPAYGKNSSVILLNSTTPVVIKDIDDNDRCQFSLAHATPLGY